MKTTGFTTAIRTAGTRKAISVMMIIVILTSFCACNRTQGTEETATTGILFLGYYETYENYYDSMPSSPYLSEYPSLGEIKEKDFVVANNGTETYAILPSSSTKSVCIKELIYDSELNRSEKGKTLFESDDTTPIIVTCNFSDLFPDVIITIADKSGAVTEFSPQISPKDGRIEILSESKQSIRDLTHYA